jgi:hypothetical protein
MKVIPNAIRKLFKHLPFFGLLLLVIPSFSQNDCDELVCNGDLQISLNVACEFALTPDQLLEAPAPGDYSIQIFDEHGDFLRDTYLTAADAGNTVKYQINCGGNSCWGQIIVEANIIPMLSSPCSITEDGSIPADCTLWCTPSGTVPASLVTPEEAEAAFGDCGPDLIGDLRVVENREGDICSPDGEVVTITYSGKVMLHGQIQNVEILTQRFTTIRLDITDDTFNFPDPVILDCDYLEELEDDYEFGSPESILASTQEVTQAYPYYIDKHDTVLNIVRILDTTLVVVDQMLRDTMIKQTINGEELWVLTTIVDKVFEEEVTERFDTIGFTNPSVPIIDRVCNVLSGYSDVQFDACGQGIKILRTWNLIDWCNTNVDVTGRQSIEIIDSTPPEVVQLVNGEYLPVTILSDVTTSIEPWLCSAVLALPELTVKDNCDYSPNVVFSTNEGVVEGDYVTDLWLGQSPITIEATVTDDCGNHTVVSYNVIVVDEVPPVAVCESSIQVALTSAEGVPGVAKVFADALDEGSHDSGCGEVSITVVRLDDWREVVRDCRDNIVGFAPVSCHAITSDVDLGAPVFKDDCDATGENIAQITERGDYVKFCCEDSGKIIQVLLFVEDKQGNVNQCIINVEVIDTARPTLVCQDEVISCVDGDYLAAPAMLGSSCVGERSYDVELLSENRSNNACAGGQTVREWYIDIDNSGDFSEGDAYCQQIISVDAETAFNPYTIKWPKSYDGKSEAGINIEFDGEDLVEVPVTVTMGDPFSCVPGNTAEEPVWCDTECGLVGYSMESDTITASDACLKIIRRWTVVDWCTFDANGSDIDDENDSTDSFEAVEDWAQFEDNAPTCPDYAASIGDPVYFRYTNVDEDGYYTYDQVIVVNDDTAPEINAPATYVVNTTGGATSKDDIVDCVGSEGITASANDLCGGELTESNLLQWQITVSSGGNVVASKSVRGPEATMNSQEGSPGDVHIITWRVKDGCGNESVAETIVTFGDQQAPTPFCVAGLTTAFMAADGTVAVWANEFDFGSFDNCTAVEDLRFAIVRSGESLIAADDPSFGDQSSITFHCSNFSSFEELDVYVIDLNGNADFCTVGIVLADNGNICSETEPAEEVEEEEEMEEEEMIGSSATIGGQISTIHGVIVDDVAVTLSANLSEYPITVLTDETGSYAFTNNPLGENYNITPEKTGEFMDGISTLDLLLISRHIVGLQAFDNPYTILAADASNDGRISSVDLSELKRLVLGVTNEFRNVNSWIFVDANQSFFDQSNPWPFNADIDLRELQSNEMAENFVGIKLGDVNGSYAGTEERSSGSLTLQTEDQIVSEGSEVIVDVTAENFNQVSGYQLALAHKGLTFNGLTSGAIELDETNIHTNNEILSMVWFSPEMVEVNANTTLFSLVFEANSTLKLSESIALNNRVLIAEAYAGIGDNRLAVNIDFEKEFDGNVLHQNQPNPFDEVTNISFNLTQTDLISLRVFDITGKQVYSINTTFAAGTHNITLDKEISNASGILYYTLEVGDYVETKKMVKLN